MSIHHTFYTTQSPYGTLFVHHTPVNTIQFLSLSTLQINDIYYSHNTARIIHQTVHTPPIPCTTYSITPVTIKT